VQKVPARNHDYKFARGGNAGLLEVPPQLIFFNFLLFFEMFIDAS